MTISSRTPEGLPNHCPICNSDVCIEPSALFGDATCPQCGSLLWFLNVKSTTRLYDRSASHSIRDRVITIVAKQLGVAPDKIAENVLLVNDLGADSLDTVELIMELEEEFDRP